MRWLACWAEPHCVSTVVHAVANGRRSLPGAEPGVAGHVGSLLPGLGHAPADDLVDDRRVDAGAGDDLKLGVTQRLGGLEAREPAVALADRCADRLDDDRLAHVDASQEERNAVSLESGLVHDPSKRPHLVPLSLRLRTVARGRGVPPRGRRGPPGPPGPRRHGGAGRRPRRRGRRPCAELADRIEPHAPAAAATRARPGSTSAPGARNRGPRSSRATRSSGRRTRSRRPSTSTPATADGVVVGTATYGAAYEGPPGCVHGGMLAAAFDIILGAASVAAQRPALTGTLTVRYRKGTPLHREIRYEGRLDRVEGRRTHVVARVARRRRGHGRGRGRLRLGRSGAPARGRATGRRPEPVADPDRA